MRRGVPKRFYDHDQLNPRVKAKASTGRPLAHSRGLKESELGLPRRVSNSGLRLVHSGGPGTQQAVPPPGTVLAARPPDSGGLGQTGGGGAPEGGGKAARMDSAVCSARLALPVTRAAGLTCSSLPRLPPALPVEQPCRTPALGSPGSGALAGGSPGPSREGRRGPLTTPRDGRQEPMPSRQRTPPSSAQWDSRSLEQQTLALEK